MRNNVIQLYSRPTIDYCEDREAAQFLVDKLMSYYHGKGHFNVKVWLEPNEQRSGRRFWDIRSNIIFKVPQI